MIWFGGKLPNLDVLNRVETETLGAHLGIHFCAVDADTMSASMPVRASNCQPYGILHGGASVVLIETLGSVAATCTIDASRQRAVGLEVNANHLRAVADGEVRGTARALHCGRSTQVWAVDIHDSAGRLSCSGRLTIALIN